MLGKDKLPDFLLQYINNQGSDLFFFKSAFCNFIFTSSKQVYEV